MPSDKHLQVVEIATFTPGLWTSTSQYLMPGTAAQIMQDCYPQPGGGLRAFFKASSLSVSGINKISAERVIGLHAKGGTPARSGTPSDTTDRYLVTYQNDGSLSVGSRCRPRLYRMDGSNSETTWTEINVTSGSTLFNLATNDNNAPQKSSLLFFRNTAGTPNDKWVMLVMRYVAAVTRGSGLYRLNYNDLSAAQKAIEIVSSVTDATNPSGAITTHQARVLISSNGATTPERLTWSNVGDAGTFAAANFLDVEPNQDLPGIIGLHPQPPGDIIVMKEGAPLVVVQGDITAPTVRAQLEGIHPGGTGVQDFGRTPEGVTFIATDGYIYLTDGYTAQNLSEQLAGFAVQQPGDAVSPGDTNFINEFLFAPNGNVLHWPTKSWFTQTQLAGIFHNVERYTRTIWGPVGTGNSFALNSLKPFPGTNRVSTYTWKSAPLREPSGRQLTIREVEIVYQSYDANATFQVTVGSQAVTQTLQSTTRGSIRFYFLQQAPMLDVQIVSTAGNGSHEAPTIEAVKIKYPIASHSF